MINKNIMNVLLIPMLTAPALAQTTLDKDAGGITVKSCESYREGSVVTFKVGTNGIEQGVIARSGCATKTYSPGVVSDGMSIIIKGENKTSSYTVPKGDTKKEDSKKEDSKKDESKKDESKKGESKKEESRRDEPKQKDNSNPREISEGGGSTAPVDNRKTEPDSDIRRTAKDSANRFANLVVNNMGKIENIRYNLYLGFREAQQLYSILGENYKSYPEYSQGFATGQASGHSSGYQAGTSEGQSVGSNTARRDVVNAFSGAMATGTKPASAPRAKLDVQFGGLNANLSAPESIESRFKDKEAEIRRQLQAITVFEDGIILGEDVYVNYYKVNDLLNLQTYNFDYILGFYRAERAFQSWQADVFNDRASTLEYYKKITDSSQYKDASANATLFYNEFIQQYDDVIAKKWNTAVTKPNAQAKTIGQVMYVQILKSYVQDLGTFDGTAKSFKSSSVVGFYKSLYPAYIETYNQTFNTYATSPVIMDLDFTIMPATQNGSLAIGDGVVVVLKSAANYGMANGQITISAGGSAILPITKAQNVLPIKALSRMNQQVQFPMAYFSKMTSPDTQVQMNVDVNGISRTFTLTATFEALVARIAQTKQQNLKTPATNQLVQFLQAEWKQESARVTNGFNNNKGTLLIERLVRFANTLAPADKAQLQGVKAQIRAAYGERPGMFSGLRDDWDSAMQILARAGL